MGKLICSRINKATGKRMAQSVAGCGLLIFLLPLLPHTGLGEIISPDRRTPWNAGVAGGIPNRTVIFTTLTPSATAAQINSAIANCPSDQVVLLAAGRYNLTGSISFNDKRGVTLRGAGPKDTILHFSGFDDYANIFFRGPNFRDAPSSGPDPTKLGNWTAGYAKGTTQITLSSTSGLALGNVLVLDQLNDNIDVNNNGSEGCNYCSRGGGSRAQQQYVKVVAINGNLVTISPGLHMPNWSASLSPQAFWWGNSTEMCGMEDLTVTNATTDVGRNIGLLNSYNCWIKNVHSYNAAEAHVKSYQGGRIEVRHSYFFGTKNAASQSYGVLWTYASDCLVEDNIFEKVTSPIMQGAGSSGCVAAYNFMTNMYYTASPGWMIAGLSGHASHNCMILWEGNYGNAAYLDFIHGSGSHVTILRNRLIGWEPNKTSNTSPIVFEATNHFGNVVGNLLGKAGYHNKYEVSGSDNSGDTTAIYVLGYYNTYHTYPANYDPAVKSAIIRHGNYDVVTGGIRWDPNISDRNLPDSFYFSSKPIWFGDRPWPPFDPNNPSAAEATAIPAGYRYVFGQDPPASSTQAPSPPKNLRVVSQ